MTAEKAANKRVSGQQGFTLLELMISIVLMGMVVLITAGALRLGFRSAESGQRKIESIERFRTSLNIIESQIQSAFVIKKIGTEADMDFAQVKGDRNSLEFRSFYSMWGGTRGPVLVKYSVKEGDMGGRNLYVNESPIVIPDVTKEVRLIENANDIFFEYYTKGPTDEKGSWANDWTDKDNIPGKIRLTIRKDMKVLPLIIPLRIGAKMQQLKSVAVSE